MTVTVVCGRQERVDSIVRMLSDQIPLPLPRGGDPKEDVRWLFVGFDREPAA